MLLELRVSDFAVIEDLNLSLQPGLTVFTGETGTGKSLLVDALSALLGQRVTQEVIRSGASRAQIEGVFAAPGGDTTLAALLEEHGLEAPEEGLLILSREITSQGRTVARINGRAVPVTVLREVGARLVDIHGQSEHLSLLDPRSHRELVDAFGGLAAERQALEAQVTTLRRLRHDLSTLDRQEADQSQRQELLRFQVEEVLAAHLRPGEEEALRQEREVLANAQRLQEWALAAHQALSADSPAAVDLVEQASAALKEASRVDAGLDPHLAALTDASISLAEVSRALRSYAEGIAFNPAQQAEVEERLELIGRLERKYGPSVEEVLAFATRAQEELAQVESQQERRAEMERRIASLEEELGQQAHRLSRRRQEAAERLEHAVARELGDLRMGHVRFAVRQDREASSEGLPLPDGQRYAFTPSGIDRVEFLLSANPGEEIRPLARVASGGETSRLMLAMKSALQGADTVPTLVFDEIEMGVGGRGGDIVGRKLWSLARGRQVLSITHLPQVACYGDDHLRVVKEVVVGRTFTHVQPLSAESRIAEVAAMLGGASPQLQEGARELMERARSWRKQAPP